MNRAMMIASKKWTKNVFSRPISVSPFTEIPDFTVTNRLNNSLERNRKSRFYNGITTYEYKANYNGTPAKIGSFYYWAKMSFFNRDTN